MSGEIAYMAKYVAVKQNTGKIHGMTNDSQSFDEDGELFLSPNVYLSAVAVYKTPLNRKIPVFQAQGCDALSRSRARD